MCLRVVSLWAVITHTRPIQSEQAKGNPLARMIVGLKFDRNMVTMALEDPYAEEEEDRVSE